MNKKIVQLNIGWLYPELMSTYGDHGNIVCLQKRLQWRGISSTITPINEKTSSAELKQVDLIFGGGAQDREQAIVMEDLKLKKGPLLKDLIEQNVPALFVCGSPQLMGNYYEPSFGERIEGLGIFDIVSIHPGESKKRLIGNIAAEVIWSNLDSGKDKKDVKRSPFIVGFENHGGRTYLGPRSKPFATVLKGNGNNGEDRTEGVVYKNAIGCYFHGPLLPKNPHIADFLISKALEVKYKEKIVLPALDDSLEWIAHNTIARRLGIQV